VRIDRPDAQGILWVKAPAAAPKGVVVIVPGAQMTAERYTWLAESILQDGYAVVLVEPALEWRTFSSAPNRQVAARYVAIPHALAALDLARARWPDPAKSNLIAVGHSLGAAVILELLDPSEASFNINTKPPPGFQGVDDIDKAVILGTSMQATGGAFTLAHRSDTRPLRRPVATKVLMIAGENDGMARPDLMQKTAARYDPPLTFQIIDGANHLQWSAGRGPMDRQDLDKPATISADEQQRRTLEIIRFFLRP